jgi:hypothetical protein
MQWTKEIGQILIYKTLHRKPKIEQHEPYKNHGWNQLLWKGKQFLHRSATVVTEQCHGWGKNRLMNTTNGTYSWSLICGTFILWRCFVSSGNLCGLSSIHKLTRLINYGLNILPLLLSPILIILSRITKMDTNIVAFLINNSTTFICEPVVKTLIHHN